MTEQSTETVYAPFPPFETDTREIAGYRVTIVCGLTAFPWPQGGVGGADVRDGVTITVTPDEEIGDIERYYRTIERQYHAPVRHTLYPDRRNKLGQLGAYVPEWPLGEAFEVWLAKRIDKLLAIAAKEDVGRALNRVDREYIYTASGRHKVYKGKGEYDDGYWFFAPNDRAYPDIAGHWSEPYNTRGLALSAAEAEESANS